jgi:hypothetical protein
VTYNMANDDKSFTKKYQGTAWSGMSPCLQTRRPELYCLPAGLRKSVDCILVDLQPRVETLSIAFFVDMINELSSPFSEKARVETDLPLCTTSLPNLIVCKVLMTFVCIIIYSSVCKHISEILLFVFYCIIFFFFCHALMLTVVQCWDVIL